MGKEDAAYGTGRKHIQMGANTTIEPSNNPCEANYNPAVAQEHTTNMAKKANHKEVDPYGGPYKARLL